MLAMYVSYMLRYVRKYRVAVWKFRSVCKRYDLNMDFWTFDNGIHQTASHIHVCIYAEMK